MPDTNRSNGGAVLALPADLIFGARIRAAAEQAGIAVTIAKSPDDLLAKLDDEQVCLIILDLDRRALAIGDVVARIRAKSNAQILAYVSHVREDAIAAARAAGVDRVMARGAFAKQVVEILAGTGADQGPDRV